MSKPKLKAVVDKIEDVPEAQRDLYEEREDGKFALAAEGVEDVSGLKTALQKERKRANDAERKIKAVEDVDVDEYETLKAEKEERERTGDSTEKKHQRDLKKWQDANAELTDKVLARDKKIYELVAENVAKDAIEAADGNIKLLLPHVLKRVKVEEEDGEFTAVILDEKGEIDTKTKSVEDLVTGLRSNDDFASAFYVTGASGSGAQSTGTRGTPPNDRKKAAATEDDVADEKRRSGVYAI